MERVWSLPDRAGSKSTRCLALQREPMGSLFEEAIPCSFEALPSPPPSFLLLLLLRVVVGVVFHCLHAAACSCLSRKRNSCSTIPPPPSAAVVPFTRPTRTAREGLHANAFPAARNFRASGKEFTFYIPERTRTFFTMGLELFDQLKS